MQGLAVLSFLIFQFSSGKKLTNLGVPPLGNPGFTDVNIKGWIIKFSGGSRISSRGVPTPEFGPKTYYLTRFLPKTAWKWKKFDWCAFLAGLTWVKSCLASFASWKKAALKPKRCLYEPQIITQLGSRISQTGHRRKGDNINVTHFSNKKTQESCELMAQLLNICQ